MKQVFLSRTYTGTRYLTPAPPAHTHTLLGGEDFLFAWIALEIRKRESSFYFFYYPSLLLFLSLRETTAVFFLQEERGHLLKALWRAADLVHKFQLRNIWKAPAHRWALRPSGAFCCPPDGLWTLGSEPHRVSVSAGGVGSDTKSEMYEWLILVY